MTRSKRKQKVFSGDGYLAMIRSLSAGINREQDLFKSAVETLYADMSKDILRQIELGSGPSQIDKSTAHLINVETFNLLVLLQDPGQSPEEKIRGIELYHAACMRLTHRYDWLKSIATVVTAALGVVVGATIGMAIGVLLGAWVGPGAAFTSLVGLWFGATNGAAIGVSAAALVTGVGAGVSTGMSFFRYNRLLGLDVNDVTKAARQLPSQTII